MEQPKTAAEELDFQEKSADHSLDVTTSDQEAVPANSARTGLLVVNISDTRIHVQLGRPATATTSIPLNADGGNIEINKANLFKGSIHVIHGGVGNKRLCIVEIETRYAY
ncbi:hypothetical protein ES703_70984 [subsurface metagenome]